MSINLGYPLSNNVVGHCFPAYGTSSGFEVFSARMREQLPASTPPIHNPHLVYGAHVYNFIPGLWVMWFNGLRPGQFYTFELFDENGVIEHSSTNISVAPQKFGATIYSPMSAQTVGDPFLASGECGTLSTSLGCCALFQGSTKVMDLSAFVMGGFWGAGPTTAVPKGTYDLRVSDQGGNCNAPDASVNFTVS